MDEFEGKVAVITGAASGIGLAMAERFGREGMKVVLADIEQDALAAAVRRMQQQECDALGVVTDVASAESVEKLARETLDSYGKIHVVCNNAGVINSAAAGAIWEASLNDWRWLFGVNIWGVIHGMRTFLPIMLRQDEPGHMINTASLAGLTPGSSIYGVTKHAVVALSEALYSQLRARDAKVGVSCLCPIFVNTRIVEAERNRPPDLLDGEPLTAAQGLEWLSERLRNGVSPDEMADVVLDAVREDRFYIFPTSEADEVVRTRMMNIMERRNPKPRLLGQPAARS
jgi:NAD(P)-dependent dehydrogenase (short-subunit alcohol dehydrogenase family)